MVNNRWRRWTYTLWAPFYDVLATPFRARRARSLAVLNPKPGERVLIVGAGTGLDLPLLGKSVVITATDITPAMLTRLEQRATRLGLAVEAQVMDAGALTFADGSFDAVILHLILAVVPDPMRAIREVHRVLRPGGRAIIFDKFVPDGGRPLLLQRLAAPLLRFLATDVTRKLGPILAEAPELRVVHDEPAGLRGFFRIVLVEKAVR
jgi:ubiquinone/menaquinone biosynthesis C-methylase UbiE